MEDVHGSAGRFLLFLISTSSGLKCECGRDQTRPDRILWSGVGRRWYSPHQQFSPSSWTVSSQHTARDKRVSPSFTALVHTNDGGQSLWSLALGGRKLVWHEIQSCESRPRCWECLFLGLSKGLLPTTHYSIVEPIFHRQGSAQGRSTSRTIDENFGRKFARWHTHQYHN